MADEVTVFHNREENRFQVELGGEVAILEYEEQDRGLFLAHTWVPQAIQGRGVGEQLARTALEYARQNGSAVVPGCSFVRSFISRHPEYVDVVHPKYRRMVGAE